MPALKRVIAWFFTAPSASELASANAFDYLTTQQRHAEAMREHPSAWMPWTYRQTLAPITPDPNRT
jgi:hypothetical protein